jgi:hypothetical protein
VVLVIQIPGRRSNIILGSKLGYVGAGHPSLVKVAWVLRMGRIEEEALEKVPWVTPGPFIPYL